MLREHAALIADFYARLDEPEPFWISPREASSELSPAGGWSESMA